MSGLTQTAYRTKLMVMESNNQIQKARDVLAKWREAAPSSMALGFADPGEGWFALDNTSGGEIAVVDTAGIARLIVGTAGNPELLDAINWLLADELSWMRDNPDGWPRKAIIDVAAAILSADERMSA